MSTIPGSVKVTGFVAPSDSTDVYPAHDEEYGAGGYRSVIDLVSRDAITTARRKEDMLVYVRSTGLTYQLDGGIDNINWVEYKPAQVGGGSAEYPIQTGKEGKYLQTNGENVMWSDAPFNPNAPTINFGTYQLNITSSPGVAGTSIDWLTVGKINNTIAPVQKINNKRLLLKAGRVYKVDGGITQTTATNGTIQLYVTTKKVSDGTLDLQHAYIYISPVANALRLNLSNTYIKPIEDLYLEMIIAVNSLVSCTSFVTVFTITEYDVMGLKEVPGFKLDTEVLTTKRWLDDKPIYRKVINFGALPNNNTKNVAHGLTNIEMLNIGDMSYVILGNTIKPINNSNEWKSSIDHTNISIVTTGDYSTYNAVVVIYYTKATDTATSPVALVGGANNTGFKYTEGVTAPSNPKVGDEWFDQNDGVLYKSVSDGVNTIWMAMNNAVGGDVVNYDISTNEFVLPFSRNGKIVYGKEIDFGALPNATTKNVAHGLTVTSIWLDSSKSYAKSAANVYTSINYPQAASGNTITSQWTATVDGTNVTMVAGSDRSAFTAKIVVNYTKE